MYASNDQVTDEELQAKTANPWRDAIASEEESPPDKRKRGGGPQTPEGKAASSRNATRHGILSPNPTAGGESKAEWKKFVAGIRRAFDPVGTFEEELVYGISVDQWNLRRAIRTTTALVQLNHDKAGDPKLPPRYPNPYELPPTRPETELEVTRRRQTRVAGSYLPAEKDLERLMRYQTTLERSIERKIKMLNDAQRRRHDDKATPGF